MENLIVLLLNGYSFVFIARALLSWFRIDSESPMYPVVNMIHSITEPVLAPIRSFMPRTGQFDLSLIVAIFGLRLLIIPLVQAIIPG